MERLKVIFKKCNDGKVIAFFPELKVNYGNIASYMHIGQHGEASYSFYSNLKNANKNEYNSLLEELKHIYDDCVLVVKEKLYYEDLVRSWR